MNSKLAKVTAKLTPKQRKFYKVYAETLNATEAAMQSYDCKDRNVAKALGAENLAKLNFTELLDAVGLTDDDLALALREGRHSTRAVVFGGKIQGVPDYATRHKYVETLLKVKGKLADKLELTGEDGGPLQMQLVAGVGFINKPDDSNN